MMSYITKVIGSGSPFGKCHDVQHCRKKSSSIGDPGKTTGERGTGNGEPRIDGTILRFTTFFAKADQVPGIWDCMRRLVFSRDESS